MIKLPFSPCLSGLPEANLWPTPSKHVDLDRRYNLLFLKSVSHSVMSNSFPPHGLYSPPGSSIHRILQARILKWVTMPSSEGVFPTQGWNPGLLHCRQILYCLSHQGSSLINTQNDQWNILLFFLNFGPRWLRW